MRTIDQIKRDIAESEAMADSDLKPQNGLSGSARRSLYRHRAQSLQEELRQAEARRQAILSVQASTSTPA